MKSQWQECINSVAKQLSAYLFLSIESFLAVSK